MRVVVLLLLLVSTSRGDEDPKNRDAERYFEQNVRPILAKRCFACHGPDKQQGELRLDSQAAMKQGNSSGPVIAPGRPEASRLVQVIRYADDDVQMPPKGKLPEGEIAALTRWIKSGAFWPKSPEPTTVSKATSSPDGWKQHWAFRPIGRPVPPPCKTADWPQTPVDSFVLAQLEQHGLTPSPAADRRTLLRRLSFDLIGLPPTPEEVEAFQADASPEATRRVVDRLLDSPHYGERWARRWLDVARYADTKGYVFQEDRNYPEAYKYRDWVIESLNRDLPYDRFLKLQIAADQLAGDDPRQLSAMGFLTLGRRFINNKHDIIDDRIDVLTRGLMGLTVTCARCHDHKFDPIPAADYYSLYGVFASSREPKDAPSPLRLVDADKPFDPYVFLRGDQGNHGPRVPRRFLMALSGEGREPFEHGSGRIELAEAIASAENPLTARVIVNRVWQAHFGQGLVATPSDFGLRSDPPSHPRLLDFLAGYLIDEGWSLKRLHRLILLSATYQQQSADRPACRAADPENHLLWRMNRRRLDFEAFRDAWLAVSGRLDRRTLGPSVDLTSQPFTTRRTLYGFIDRQNLPGLFRSFDFASPDTHSPRRFVTTTPQQALFQMNSPFALEAADALASRLTAEERSRRPEAVERLYRLAYGRAPAGDERLAALEFLDQAADAADDPAPQVVWRYGFATTPTNEEGVTGFQPLPTWTGSAYQGGAKLPDPKTGWVTLNATGGHPGDKQHAAVRRWVAPRDGAVAISGELRHASDKGDGVRALALSSRTGRLGDWTAQHQNVKTNVARVEVRRGDTLDFVTDCRAETSFDSFQWTVSLRLQSNADNAGRSRWDSKADFAAPAPRPLDAWARFAQILLMSNEFMFLD